MNTDLITVKADVSVVNQEHQLMGLLRLHDLVQAGLA
tara:strand:+ start:27 stop:137 length:111 start_codon:yes stop_codon:yes gene_type:complete